MTVPLLLSWPCNGRGGAARPPVALWCKRRPARCHAAACCDHTAGSFDGTVRLWRGAQQPEPKPAPVVILEHPDVMRIALSTQSAVRGCACRLGCARPLQRTGCLLRGSP